MGAPRFMCLADVSMCTSCWKGFGTFQAKCHCHSCGTIVCSSCATNTDNLPYKRFDSATDSYTGSKRSYSVCPHCAEILNPKKKNAKTIKQIPYVEHFDDLWRQARMQGWLGIRKIKANSISVGAQFYLCHMADSIGSSMDFSLLL